MFCPSCRYEFRRGFTKCNECGVDLVDTLPSEVSGSGLKSPELLWSGDDDSIRSDICHALGDAGVRFFYDLPQDFQIYVRDPAQYKIWVSTEDMAAALKVINEVEAREANEAEAGTSEDGDLGEALAAEDDEGADDLPHENVARELDPEDATAEIWSGADATTAEMLKSCLAEIGIACYVDRPESGNLDVRVLPEDEKRASSIVRQVIEGVPPE
ncbi:MAG TPA: hypothetical protein VJN21_15695 [Candidatus Acidoferrales bacterium]|nr:hypothetical protein [Candidatus Acidoferrales bacterium]